MDSSLLISAQTSGEYRYRTTAQMEVPLDSTKPRLSTKTNPYHEYKEYEYYATTRVNILHYRDTGSSRSCTVPKSAKS